MFGTLKKCFLSCCQGVVNFFKRMKECFKQAGSACCRGVAETSRKMADWFRQAGSACCRGLSETWRNMVNWFRQAGSACCRGLSETCTKMVTCCQCQRCCKKEQDDPAGLELSYFLIAYWLLFWQYLSEYHFAWKSIIQWKWSHLFYNILFSLTCRV